MVTHHLKATIAYPLATALKFRTSNYGTKCGISLNPNLTPTPTPNHSPQSTTSELERMSCISRFSFHKRGQEVNADSQMVGEREISNFDFRADDFVDDLDDSNALLREARTRATDLRDYAERQLQGPLGRRTRRVARELLYVSCRAYTSWVCARFSQSTQ